MSDPAARPESREQAGLIDALTENLDAELRSAATYRYFAECEIDPHRMAILNRLAEAEERHAEKWRTRLAELGVEPKPKPVSVPRWYVCVQRPI